MPGCEPGRIDCWRLRPLESQAAPLKGPHPDSLGLPPSELRPVSPWGRGLLSPGSHPSFPVLLLLTRKHRSPERTGKFLLLLLPVTPADPGAASPSCVPPATGMCLLPWQGDVASVAAENKPGDNLFLLLPNDTTFLSDGFELPVGDSRGSCSGNSKSCFPCRARKRCVTLSWKLTPMKLLVNRTA